MNPVYRILFNVAGTVCVVVGIAGVFLPLLPATPFLLLAAACYVRGSARLYNWLMGHRVLGPYIRNIRDRKGMPVRAKVYTLALFWASILVSIYRIDTPLFRGLLFALAIGVSILILKIKTLQEEN